MKKTTKLESTLLKKGFEKLNKKEQNYIIGGDLYMQSPGGSNDRPNDNP